MALSHTRCSSVGGNLSSGTPLNRCNHNRCNHSNMRGCSESQSRLVRTHDHADACSKRQDGSRMEDDKANEPHGIADKNEQAERSRAIGRDRLHAASDNRME